MKKIKQMDKNKIEWLILGILFIITFLLNFLTPLITDDFSYAMVDGKHLSGIKQIIDFQIWHYFNWGGRTIAHVIVQLFLLMPKMVFNIFNTIMNVLEVYLIYKIAKGEKERNPLILIVIFFLIWFFFPSYGVSNLWLTGSCNYLWTTVIILFFIYQYQKEKEDTWIRMIGIFLLGILAGWTNENTSFGCLVIIGLFILLKKIEKKKITKWNILGLIGNGCGFLLLILAPGNYARSKLLVDDRSMIGKIIYRFLEYTENIPKYVIPFIILLTILISIYIYKKKKISNHTYPYIIGAFFAIYSMLLSPTFPDRAWTGVAVFFIIPIAILLFDLPKVSKFAYVALIDSLVISFLNK